MSKNEILCRTNHGRSSFSVYSASKEVCVNVHVKAQKRGGSTSNAGRSGEGEGASGLCAASGVRSGPVIPVSLVEGIPAAARECWG